MLRLQLSINKQSHMSLFNIQSASARMKMICFFTLALYTASSFAQQQSKWTLATQDTRVVLTLDKLNRLSVAELSSLSNKWNWTKKPSVFPLLQKVRIDSVDQKIKWIFQKAAVTKDKGTKVTLTFASAKPNLELRSVWEAKSGPGPIRHTVYLKNRSGKTITIYNQESMDIHVGAPEGITKAVYVNDDAAAPDSIGVYHAPLVNGYSRSLTVSEGRNDWIPIIIVHSDKNAGMYMGWEWSIGRLRVSKDSDTSGIALAAGNGDEFRTDVYAGETFEVPTAFIGAYNGDVDECGNSLRKYLFNHSMPDRITKDSTFPKTEWNAFAATGKKQGGWDPEEKNYYPLIDDMQALGFEEVVLDILWWESYGKPGHIIGDRKDWPRGIPAAAKYARDRGIRFGLYENQPEYMTNCCGKTARYNEISYLLTDLHADFYRSDGTAGNVMSGTFGKDHRAHYKEDVGYWSAKGFYEVIDSLYRAFPGFSWEDCDNGGALKDYGSLKRAATIQNQDRYYPIDARRSFYDASFVLHPMQLACLTGSWEAWQAEGSVYEFRCSSMGATYWHPDGPQGGNGGPVWTPEHRAAIAKAVVTYKTKLRPLIRHANLYHIFPRPDNIHWDGIQYYDPARKTGVAYIFKPADTLENKQAVILKGLVATESYKLTFEDGTNPSVTMKGSELMTRGIDIKLEGKLASELMFIDRAENL
jgi:hypothetical protein